MCDYVEACKDGCLKLVLTENGVHNMSKIKIGVKDILFSSFNY